MPIDYDDEKFEEINPEFYLQDNEDNEDSPPIDDLID